MADNQQQQSDYSKAFQSVYGNTPVATQVPQAAPVSPYNQAMYMAYGGQPPGVAMQEPSTAQAADVQSKYGVSGAEDVAANTALAMGASTSPTPLGAIFGSATPQNLNDFEHGLGNAEYGLGQLVEHTPLKYMVSGAQRILSDVSNAEATALNDAGFPNAARFASDVAVGFDPNQNTPSDFDTIVNAREQKYQQDRQTAGQTGFDWWNLGGEAANPINYLGAGSLGGATAVGRIGAGAITGGALAETQPVVNTPGAFWWQKSKQALAGTIMGGLSATGVEAAMPLVKAGAGVLQRTFGPNVPAQAVDKMVNDSLAAKNINPASVNLNVVAGLKQEVKDAASSGRDISDDAVANLAVSRSLPTPVPITSGMATESRAQFLAEQSLKRTDPNGAGMRLEQNDKDINKAIVDNLDKLGASSGSNEVSTGNILSDKIQNMWDEQENEYRELYGSLKNTQGQPAKVDQLTAIKNIHDTMAGPENSNTYDYLPTAITKTLDSLEKGDLNLTVSQLQKYDYDWGQLAAQEAKSNNLKSSHAIYQARSILNDAPIQDDMGAQNMQIYNAAKAKYASLQSMVEPNLLSGKPNPAYQPLVKAVVMDGVAPEKLYGTYFGNATPSLAKKNMDFLGQLDPNLRGLVSNTFIGKVKNLAGGDVDNPVISYTPFKNATKDPVASARTSALLSPAQDQVFRNLAHTVRIAKTVPGGTDIGNPSGSGQALINAAMEGGKYFAKDWMQLPVLRNVIGNPLGKWTRNMQATRMLNPGVSLKSILTTGPREAAGRAAAARTVIPGAVGVGKNANQ